MKRWRFNFAAGGSLAPLLFILPLWVRGAFRLDRISRLSRVHDLVAQGRYDTFVIMSFEGQISIWREFRKIYDPSQAAEVAALNRDLPRWNLSTQPYEFQWRRLRM